MIDRADNSAWHHRDYSYGQGMRHVPQLIGSNNAPLHAQHGELVCLGKMLWSVKKKQQTPTVVIQQTAPTTAPPPGSSQPVMFAAGPGMRLGLSPLNIAAARNLGPHGRVKGFASAVSARELCQATPCSRSSTDRACIVSSTT